ncbi:hypothetical protein MKW94_023058 [Papaver nudicaule]|uniref:Uncharacterized protein n=1 Tax=Papaver nudicaule TaxID=74823 RepID=A0AA41V747_PAPNU|nr:hypothetical protein [Papaver nudicaule]
MEATQVESRKKEEPKVTNDNTSNSTSRRNCSWITRLFLKLFNVPEEAIQVECREKEAAIVTSSHNTSTSWENSSVIDNDMIRLFLYLFNMPKACYLVEGVIISLTLVEYGVLALLMFYFTSFFNYSDVRATATVNIFYFIGGILAIFAEFCKLRVGCCFMVLVNCVCYILALVIFHKISLQMEDSESSPNQKSLQALHGALFLLAVGRGVFLSTCIQEFLGAQMKKARRVSNEENDKRDDIRSGISTIRAKIVGFGFYSPQRMRMIVPNIILKLNQGSGIVRSTSLRSAAPICFTFLMYGIVNSTGETFFQDQAASVDTSSAGGDLMMLQLIARTSRFLINHLVNRVLSKSSGTGTLAILIQMGLGMLFCIVTCSIAQYTEVVRLAATKQNNCSLHSVCEVDVTLFVPQFIALGFVTGLAGEGLEAFFEHEYSNWIKIYAATISEALTGVGFLLNTVLVLILRAATKKLGGQTWFAEDLNSSRVDLFYHTLAVMCVLNFIPLYALASTCYYRKIKIQTFLLEGM